MKAKRLLTIGHSYAVTLNRRLAREMAAAGRGNWELTCAAPKYFHGSNDLAPVELEQTDADDFPVVALDAYFTQKVHVFSWGLALRELLRQDWDVIHAWEEPYILAGWEIGRLANVRSKLAFLTMQSNPKQYPWPFSWFESDSMARAAGWVSCGYSIEQNLEDRPGYGGPHAMIPLGVDVEVFKPDPEARRAALEAVGWAVKGPPVIGFAGRFIPSKGLHLLMRALDRVREPFRVLFLGSGQLEPELRAFCARLNDRGRVLHVRHDEVPRYMNAMDLLCAPSQTTPQWREQFGRMLVEAAACAVPVIGSDSGEIPTVIGDTGLVIGEADEAAWVAGISELLANPERRAELGSAGRAQAHERYSWSVVARKYLTFFESL
jgi:glycosyltransferase involved in cell wall biosynthesis